MFRNKIIILTLLLASCSLISAQFGKNLKDVIADDDGQKHTTTTIAPTTSTVQPTTSTSSSSSSTTTTTTTTTTAKPPTPPPTTSSTTSTTTTTTTTSTVAPPTTSTVPPPPTTTPAPGPYPAPSIGEWNSTCIKLKMAAQLNFTYVTKENKTAQALYNIPSNAKVDHAICDSATNQMIQLNWGPDDAQHSLTLQFELKNASSQLSMIKVNLPLLKQDFPDADENETIQLIHRSVDFVTPSKMSYHCTRAQVLNMTETIQDKEVIGTITISDVQAEAFRTANSTNGFSVVHDCDGTETSDLVPIAVGIALAALIVIVLVSYLCARRRSTSRGYMSF